MPGLPYRIGSPGCQGFEVTPTDVGPEKLPNPIAYWAKPPDDIKVMSVVS